MTPWISASADCETPASRARRGVLAGGAGFAGALRRVLAGVRGVSANLTFHGVLGNRGPRSPDPSVERCVIPIPYSEKRTQYRSSGVALVLSRVSRPEPNDSEVNFPVNFCVHTLREVSTWVVTADRESAYMRSC